MLKLIWYGQRLPSVLDLLGRDSPANMVIFRAATRQYVKDGRNSQAANSVMHFTPDVSSVLMRLSTLIALFRLRQLKKNHKIKLHTKENTMKYNLLIVFIICAAIAFTSDALAQSCRDGCDVTNVFQGDNTLGSATGSDNSAFGYDALFDCLAGYSNTAVGALSLLSVTTGVENTAVGVDAGSNIIVNNDNTAIGVNALGAGAGNDNTTIGAYSLYENSGQGNTATGFEALYHNTGNDNTAVGQAAGFSNTSGVGNVVLGGVALYSNLSGSFNTAVGEAAMYYNNSNTNTAIGWSAINKNVNGSSNTGVGYRALYNNTGSSTGSGSNNTALGSNALYSNTTGGNNIAIGLSAGTLLTTGSNNIDIGNDGAAREANTIRIGTVGTQTATFIAGIRGVPVSGGLPVAVNASGQLGVRASSARFKEAIKPMGKASEAILALQPVSFRYKKALDPKGTPEFGLVAEDVAKVAPELVVVDDHNKPFTVRYDEVNAMLLNEFLKEHRKMEDQNGRLENQARKINEQEVVITQLKREMGTVASRLKNRSRRFKK
jgi:hypothetical protein